MMTTGKNGHTVRLRLILAIAFLGGSSIAFADEATDKLTELEKQREKVNSLHSVAAMTARSVSGTRESTVETWEKKADGVRKLRRSIRTKSPDAKDPAGIETEMLMVNDGVRAWREMPMMGTKRMVFTGKAANPSEYNDIRKMLEKGESRLRDKETLLEQPCTVIEIKGKGGNDQVLASYWISDRYGIVLKSVVQGADKSVTETRVREFNVDEPVGESLFVYKPPIDAEVIDSDKMGSKKPGG